MAGSHPVEGVPSTDAASSPAGQGVPTAERTGALPGTDMPSPHANSPPAHIIFMPEPSGAAPAEGIPNRIAARDPVVYPVFGVAREQNQRAYMEDRADVLQLQLPHGEEFPHAGGRTLIHPIPLCPTTSLVCSMTFVIHDH